MFSVEQRLLARQGGLFASLCLKSFVFHLRVVLLTKLCLVMYNILLYM